MPRSKARCCRISSGFGVTRSRSKKSPPSRLSELRIFRYGRDLIPAANDAQHFSGWQASEGRMNLAVREMTLAETHLVIDYFASATPEYLDMMGVDPTKLMPPDQWRARLETEFT